MGEPKGEGRESAGDKGKSGESRPSSKKGEIKEEVEDGEEQAGVAGDEGLEDGTAYTAIFVDSASV
jgi:hypothetical protein